MLTAVAGACQAMLEIARYLQHEIEEGVNVVEAWNRANAVIRYGKGGGISTNNREEVEMAARCLLTARSRSST